MIYNRIFNHAGLPGPVGAAALMCDQCSRELDEDTAKHFSVLCAGLDLEHGAEPTDEQRAKLRKIAQDAGWTLAVDFSGTDSDLCPGCLDLPQEA